MPEGDTVWLAGRRMHGALAGSRLTASDFRVPQLATADLSGRTVREVRTHGKHMITRLEGGLTLHTHFRMDGSWHLYRSGERWRGGPAWQVRLVLTTGSWQAVGYRLPVIELFPTTAEADHLGHLGPDLLGPEWALPSGSGDAPGSVDEAVRRGYWVEEDALRSLTAQPDRTIGEALLDQRNLAGIGTLYRAETLFLRGVHPRTPVGRVRDLPSTVRLARRLLEANRKHPEQTTTGDLRRGRHHYVYGRKGQPCRRCGTPIEREEFGPPTQERVSSWCPTCQTARPTPSAGSASATGAGDAVQ